MLSVRPQGGCIYAFGILGTDLVKIGSTRGSVQRRLKQIQGACPFPLQICATVEVEHSCKLIEETIHTLLNDVRKNNEWFAVSTDQDSLVKLVQHASCFIKTQEEQRKLARELKRRASGNYGGRPRIYETPRDGWLARQRQRRERLHHG